MMIIYKRLNFLNHKKLGIDQYLLFQFHIDLAGRLFSCWWWPWFSLCLETKLTQKWAVMC